MAGINSLQAFWSFLFLIIAFFYLFRLVSIRPWILHFDAENEVGHGVMAIGMVVMLAPVGILTSDLIHWNILLFAFASLWFTFRLLARKPLLALLLGKNEGHSTIRSDAIHVVMDAGMCYMFVLMSSMGFSMTLPATYLTCLFFVSFAFLTVFYGREVSKDLQAAKIDWLKLGANLAHVLMSGVMGWMFLEMLSMTMRMGTL